MPVTCRNINVLLAYDSVFMRLILADLLGANGDTGVNVSAGNGREDCEKTSVMKPKVVLLDLVRPEYDGLYAVK